MLHLHIDSSDLVLVAKNVFRSRYSSENTALLSMFYSLLFTKFGWKDPFL